jgi:hypothetical protein
LHPKSISENLQMAFSHAPVFSRRVDRRCPSDDLQAGYPNDNRQPAYPDNQLAAAYRSSVGLLLLLLLLPPPLVVVVALGLGLPSQQVGSWYPAGRARPTQRRQRHPRGNVDVACR